MTSQADIRRRIQLFMILRGHPHPDQKYPHGWKPIGIPDGIDASGLVGRGGWTADDPLTHEVAQTAHRYGFKKVKHDDRAGFAGVAFDDRDTLAIGNRETVGNEADFRARARERFSPTAPAFFMAEAEHATPVQYAVAHEAGHHESFHNGEHDAGYPKLKAALGRYMAEHGEEHFDGPIRYGKKKPYTSSSFNDWPIDVVSSFVRSHGGSQRGVDSPSEFAAEWHAAFQLGRQSDLMTVIAQSQGWVKK